MEQPRPAADSDSPRRWGGVVAAVGADNPLALVDLDGSPCVAGNEGARRIVVLDSSFNPPTLAHDRLLSLAGTAGPFDLKVLMLAKVNVDKAIVGAQLHERLAMMQRMAVAGDARGDGSPSTALAVTAHARFVDKAHSLLSFLGEKPAAPLSTVFFIVGSDTLVRIFNPKYYEDPERELADLFRMVHLISFDRDADTTKQTDDVMSSPLAQSFVERITRLELDNERIQSISSTQVRSALLEGSEALSELVLPEVAQFLVENAHMYTSSL